MDFTGLLGAGTTTNDVDFSFGGPVADEGGTAVHYVTTFYRNRLGLPPTSNMATS